MQKLQLDKSWNTLVLLAVQFVILLMLAQLLRVGFYMINRNLFPLVDSSNLLYMLVGGLKFDIVALLYFNIIYILMQAIPAHFKYRLMYQKVCKWIFISTNSLFVALNLIDFAYYPFTLKRTTGTVFGQFSNEENFGSLILDFLLDYWYLLLIFIAIIYLISRIYKVVELSKPSRTNWSFYLIQGLSFLLIAFLFIGGVRGGWAHSTRPITLSNAGDYVDNPEEIYIVINTPFSILKTLKAVSLKELHYFDEETLTIRYPVIHQNDDNTDFKKLNVVFLIMESFGKEYIGALNKDIPNYKGYTPFLDSLIAESYTFTNAFANGRKSIDALPSVITGIPSIGEPFVLSIYSGNKTTSIAKLLADEGYETAFFHGAPNGSMGFSAYMQLAGVKHYFGKNEYNNDKDFDGIWGIWDEPFMQFMADKINNMPEPFFASFFSLSSHHPFKVPEKYAGKFPKGPLEIHEPIGYSDYALRKFFEKASKMPWFNNTVFVLCADHSSVSHLPEYQTASNAFAIPIILYHPGTEMKGVSEKLVQQIDIMPTVLNYLQYPKPYFAFGFDALNDQQTNNFVVNNIGGAFNFYQGPYFMKHDGQKVLSVHNRIVDPMLKNDLSLTNSSITDSLDNQLKAFIQRYNSSMIRNQLTVK